MRQPGNTRSNRRSRNLIIGIVAAVVLLCGCAVVCLLAALLVSDRLSAQPAPTFAATPRQVLRQPTPSSTPRVVPLRPSPTASVRQGSVEPSATPTVLGTAQPEATVATTGEAAEPTAVLSGPHSTEEQLQRHMAPTRDLRDLALRLRPGVDVVPAVVNAQPPEFDEGDVTTFMVGNVDTEEHFEIVAELLVKLPHVYMWVEEGVRVDLEDLRQSARRFEELTYPTNRAFFGSEWSPGVDNDVHLHILNATNLGDSVAGYFSSADEFSQLANPMSNQREMFYINLDNNPPGTRFYDGTLAHEFQHMIHWFNDRNEDTWVNEGMSELATELNGFSRGGADLVFSRTPDTQLTTWTDVSDLNTAHYGNAYLFVRYFLDRFGEELTQAVVASPADGPAGFSAALAAAGYDVGFDDVFADWLIANYLDNTSLEGGRYGYQADNPRQVAMEQSYRRYPVSEGSIVSQYAADYYELAGRDDVSIVFCGDTETRLTATEAYSGRYAWWASRSDDSDARLTRSFDLSALSTASLEYRTWYDIEDGYDYGYVTVSTDGGDKWTVLRGQHTRDDDPVGNAFGPGYTGASADEVVGGWLHERVDLTPYVGQELLVRFEYVTDDAVNYPGWLLDDIAVPELGYLDDGEAGNQGWISEGWLLTDNRLTQRWLVQVIETGLINSQVRRMPIDDDGCGQLDIDDLGSRIRRAVLVISALAPSTTEVAAYAFEIQVPET